MRSALLLALVACGSSAPPVGPSHKAAAPSYEASLDDVLGFLPVDSEIVVAIDARQIRGSQIWAAVEPHIDKIMGADLEEVRTACGFDPLKTVERISIGLRSYDKNVAGVFVVHGVGAGMMGCVKTRFGKGGDVTEERGVAITKSGEHEQVAWTVIGSTLIVEIEPQVSHDSLQAILASGSPLRSSKAFMAMFDQLEHGASMWGIANGRSHLFDELDSEGARPATAWGTLNITDHISLAGHATFADEPAAAKVKTLLQHAFGQAGNFIEHAEASAEKNRLSVTISIAGAQVQQLLAAF